MRYSQSEIEQFTHEAITDGHCVLRGHFPAEKLRRWNEEFQPLLGGARRARTRQRKSRRESLLRDFAVCRTRLPTRKFSATRTFWRLSKIWSDKIS